MKISNISTANPEALAPVLLAAMQRLGQLGRNGALALAAILDDDDGDFDEASQWIGDVASGGLKG